MCLGIPGRIVMLDDPAKKLATVDVSGVKRQVNIACIVDDEHSAKSCVGNWVLVHVRGLVSVWKAERRRRGAVRQSRVV